MPEDDWATQSFCWCLGFRWQTKVIQKFRNLLLKVNTFVFDRFWKTRLQLLSKTDFYSGDDSLKFQIQVKISSVNPNRRVLVIIWKPSVDRELTVTRWMERTILRAAPKIRPFMSLHYISANNSKNYLSQIHFLDWNWSL